jgi:hypothetical protein
MRRHLPIIVATGVAALLCAPPIAAQGNPLLAQDSRDSVRARVVRFLNTDSTVQAVSAAQREFLLIEDREGTGLRIVARVASKVDLYRLGRTTPDHVISGFFQPGIVAPGRIEYYVFRWVADG